MKRGFATTGGLLSHREQNLSVASLLPNTDKTDRDGASRFLLWQQISLCRCVPAKSTINRHSSAEQRGFALAIRAKNRHRYLSCLAPQLSWQNKGLEVVGLQVCQKLVLHACAVSVWTHDVCSHTSTASTQRRWFSVLNSGRAQAVTRSLFQAMLPGDTSEVASPEHFTFFTALLVFDSVRRRQLFPDNYYQSMWLQSVLASAQ